MVTRETQTNCLFVLRDLVIPTLISAHGTDDAVYSRQEGRKTKTCIMILYPKCEDKESRSRRGDTVNRAPPRPRRTRRGLGVGVASLAAVYGRSPYSMIGQYTSIVIPVSVRDIGLDKLLLTRFSTLFLCSTSKR